MFFFLCTMCVNFHISIGYIFRRKLLEIDFKTFPLNVYLHNLCSLFGKGRHAFDKHQSNELQQIARSRNKNQYAIDRKHALCHHTNEKR